MQRELLDLARCESGDQSLCGHESKYCYTCCAWGVCNYGACKEQNCKLLYTMLTVSLVHNT